MHVYLMEMKEGDGSHGKEADTEDKELVGRVLALLVEL